MDKPSNDSQTRKENSSFMKNLKIERLRLSRELFNLERSISIQLWVGETEDQYFSIDIASNQKLCVASGSIQDRELHLGRGKKILLSEHGYFNIYNIASRLGWDISKAKIDNLNSFHCSNINR